MSEWTFCTLAEIADVQTGPFGSQLHRSDYKPVGTPIITVEHLNDNRITYQNLPLVGDSDKERLSKYLIYEGDIVFSRVGSVDRRAYVSKNEDGWLFSGRLLRVRANPDVINPKFLSYYFGQESFKEHIRRIAVGATMPSINTTILSEVEVSYPSRPEQEAISAVLSSLDDKIDLLHRQNKTLEALAQTLFRHWFIDGAEDDWEEIPLKEFIDFREGPGIRNWQYVEDPDGINFINIRLIQDGEINLKSANKISREEAFGKYAHFQLQEKDMIVSTSGTLGRSAIVRSYHLPLCLNTSVIRFRPVDGTNYSYMYQYLQSEEFLSQLTSMASGSVQLNFGPTHLKRITMAIPPHSLLRDFNELSKCR